VPVVFTVAYITVAERKTILSMQRRLGPNTQGSFVYSAGDLLPGIPLGIPPKPPTIPYDDIEEIITGILNGGGLHLPLWLWYWLFFFNMGYIIKRLFEVDINIRFRCVERVGPGGHMEYAFCIYDTNDRGSATWLGFLYYGSAFYFRNITIDGLRTRCLVFSNSFDTTPINRPNYFNMHYTLLGIKLSIPLPNSYVWSIMSSAGCTIRTNGYPLLPGIQPSRIGPMVIAVFIHGHMRDMIPVAI